tara:strand:+ start:81 stop:1397 length:1317 start_codon:yes stop_codon:yes gene_type:complete
MTEEKVKNMYTDFVYPAYNEKWDEKAPEMIQVGFNNLNIIKHYIYNGKKNFDNYKMLFAGCGLGNDLIYMALMLKKYKNIKIVGIDLSSSSLEILKKRLEIYKIENVEIREMSLLDLTPEMFGKFDFINSVGVLHHLENPSLGLKTLNSVLEDDGFMDIMVYGKIGRTGLYQMQDLLKMVNKDLDELDYKTKLEKYHLIYPKLQQNNWFKKSEFLTSDHITYGDNGIIDMLLHHQDRAYTIPELYDWVEAEDLNIIKFQIDSRSKLETKIEGIEFKTKRELYEFNELFYGDIIKHSFFLSKNNNTVAKLDDLNNTLIINFTIQEEWDNLIKQLEELGHSYPSPELNFSCNYYVFNNTDKLIKSPNKMTIKFKSDFVITRILKLIDGKTKTKRLFTKVREELGVDISNEEMLERFQHVYEAFNMHDALLLKKQIIPHFI